MSLNKISRDGEGGFSYNSLDQSLSMLGIALLSFNHRIENTKHKFELQGVDLSEKSDEHIPFSEKLEDIGDDFDDLISTDDEVIYSIEEVEELLLLFAGDEDVCELIESLFEDVRTLNGEDPYQTSTVALTVLEYASCTGKTKSTRVRKRDDKLLAKAIELSRLDMTKYEAVLIESGEKKTITGGNAIFTWEGTVHFYSLEDNYETTAYSISMGGLNSLISLIESEINSCESEVKSITLKMSNRTNDMETDSDIIYSMTKQHRILLDTLHKDIKP
ncbi:MAG: hypothetical protein GY874_08120 [Desulfobacteraceae bacterium]|nr:hypothetical protein [Desulfobacteraceae bacterium]